MLLRLEKAATAVALLLVPGADSFMLAPPSARTLARRSGSYLLRAASTSTSSPSTTEEAKAALKDALVKSGGSTLAEGVVAATEALAGFNPTSSPAGAWPLHSGRWESIGEDFKGTTRTADGMECTLGRLAFNIFEPVKLPVLITGIEHTVGDRAEDADATDRPVYNFHVRWVSRDGSGLRGLCDIEGRCSEHPSKPQRIQVQFLKGTLRPDDGQDLEAWRKVVGVKDAKDDEQKGSMARLKESATKLLLKVAFGFKGPADTQGPGGELSYEMARSPKGFMDILYLDEEMRVSRGNAGGVVVATRL